VEGAAAACNRPAAIDRDDSGRLFDRLIEASGEVPMRRDGSSGRAISGPSTSIPRGAVGWRSLPWLGRPRLVTSA